MFGQKGQILLLVVLVIIVASTVGLSIATRSIISLRTSTEEAESQKALAAAEAGIERAIQGSVPIGVGDNLTNNSSYNTTVIQVQGSSFLLNGGNTILKDEGTDVWVVDHDSNSIPIYSQAKAIPYLNLYWGSTSDTGCDSAAIEVIVVAKNNISGLIKSYRYVYDNDNCLGRRAENKFTLVDSGSFSIAGGNFKYRTPDNNLANDILGNDISDVVLIRVVPIYKDSKIAVLACDHNQTPGNCTSLPPQGYVISSTGTSGQANRKLTVFKGYPQTYLPYLSSGLFVAN